MTTNSTSTPAWAIALAQQNLSDPINWKASRDPITGCTNPKASTFMLRLMSSNLLTERKILRDDLKLDEQARKKNVSPGRLTQQDVASHRNRLDEIDAWFVFNIPTAERLRWLGKGHQLGSSKSLR